ncbi:hypothetical protein CGCSCA5_v008372 [Colletotrichum siamense]|nr:hypothetical protein CGCSCA5_v008372 [Colletotrichum siamense]
MPIWSSSFVSFSSSISVNGKENSQRYAKQTQRSPDGTTIKTASQKGGGPMYTETLQYDSHGRPIVDGRALRERSKGSRPYRRRVGPEVVERTPHIPGRNLAGAVQVDEYSERSHGNGNDVYYSATIAQVQ